MMFDPSPRSIRLRERMIEFLEDHLYPAEPVFEEQLRDQNEQRVNPPVLEGLKKTARDRGLWNLFLPHPEAGHEPMTNLDYAPLAELSGRSLPLGPESMNCSAPDTGNMELLSLFGTPEQKARWLRPLMDGEIRSAYAMTEPQVASSDASNIELSIVREGHEWVLNGRKWWISGAIRPQCELFIVMGITDAAPDAPRHRRHSMILVPKDTPGVTIERDLSVLGYHTFESHAEITFTDVRVPVTNMLGEVGAGFAMSQARLGPGRIHHCMRMIGAAERALRADDRQGEQAIYLWYRPRGSRSGPRVDSRLPDRDRPGTTLHAVHRSSHGHSRQHRCRQPDIRNQGRRPQCRRASPRTRHAGTRRRRPRTGLPAGADVCRSQDRACGRWSGRSPPSCCCPHRAQAIHSHTTPMPHGATAHLAYSR